MKKRTKIIILAVTAILCLVAAYAHLSGAGEIWLWMAKAKHAEIWPESAAVSACKNDVLDSANDPESIEWANESSWTIKKIADWNGGSQEWTVRMSVRGKNGFGAMVLNNSTCRVVLGPTGPFVMGRTSD